MIFLAYIMLCNVQPALQHRCSPLLSAISAAMVATNRMTKPVFVSYVISQVLGAIFGALFLHWCLPKAAHAFVTSGAPHTK